MKIKFALILTFFFVFVSKASSQEENANEVVITGNAQSFETKKESNSSPATHLMEEKSREALKGSLTVVQEIEGVIYLAGPSKSSFSNGTKMLFIRKRGIRFEPIAQGAVIGEEVNPQTKTVLIKVQLDRDTVTKYPQTSDHAVFLANEMALNEGDKKESHDAPQVAEQKDPGERIPGYLEFGGGLLFGSTSSTSSTQANDSKKVSGYRFKTFHFAYYSDFFPVGVEIDTHSGTFPTQIYTHELVNSDESVSVMNFDYRFKKIGKNLAPRLRVSTLSDQFNTNNNDEHLLTTKISGFGVGARMDYEFASPIWKPKKGDSWFQPQAISLEFTYYPSLTATDTGISRGTSSSGSSGMLYGIRANALMWLDFVPVFKRWVVQASYRVRSYDLKFSGATVSEVGNPYQIPQNGTGHEKESDFRFFIGIRIDDPIRMLFKDKNEEGKAK